MEQLFLALPDYGGCSTAHRRTAMAVAASAAEQGYHLHVQDGRRSLICLNFNDLWCAALNMREAGTDLKWFVLLHADIGTSDTEWLPKLIRTAEANGLDALAAVALIKDMTGDTSTALWREDGEIHRLSVAELRQWPVLATNEWTRDSCGATLLINTGMLALRLGRDWNPEFCFHIENGIERGPDGKWRARVLSEDWRMSLWLSDRGIPYGVLQTIPVIHDGYWWWQSEMREV